jgi:hypothetical protein
VTRAEPVPAPDWTGAAVALAVMEATLAVLPEPWRTLPDGRPTHLAIAQAAAERYRSNPKEAA